MFIVPLSSEKMILHTYDLKITFQVKKYRKTVTLIGETTDSNQSSHSSHSFRPLIHKNLKRKRSTNIEREKHI